jgi:hypothetical protein
MADNPAGTRQTDGKNMVWFGEIEKKLAKLSKTILLLAVLPLLLFTIHEGTMTDDCNTWSFVSVPDPEDL